MSEYNADAAKLHRLDRYIDTLSEKEGALINILHEAQELFGYLPRDVQLFIARKLGIPAAKVFGVVTFYSHFTMEPKGKHVVSVCMGTACFVKGAEKILEALKTKLNIKSGTRSEDGMYTIDTVRCIGACGLAPVVVVDGKVHGRVTDGDVDGIIAEMQEAPGREPQPPAAFQN